MLARSLWRSFQNTLQKKSSRSRRQLRARTSPQEGMQSWSAEVLECRLLLPSVLVDPTPVATISGTEGSPATNVVLMTFTDDNADAQAVDFTITSLDWGTTTVGTTPTAQVVVDPNYSGVGSGW